MLGILRLRAEIGGDRIFDRRMIIANQHARPIELPLCIDEREARIRRPDIADEEGGRKPRDGHRTAALSAPTKFSRQAVISMRSNGLTMSASPSSLAAPAKHDSTSTPGSAGFWLATNSLATRFIPS